MRSHFIVQSYLFLLLLFSQNAIAQDKAFLEAVEKVGPQVKTILLPQGEMHQSLIHLEGNLVEIKTEMMGNKTSTVEKYVFNLADISLNDLAHEIFQKGMYVKLAIVNEAKYIRKRDEDGNIDFISSIRVAVDDADHSRAFIDAIKPSIELAQKVEAERYTYTSLAEINTELARSINFSFDGQKEQSWSSEPGREEKIRFEIKKETGTDAFSFNLNDLDPDEIEVTVTKRAINLSLEAKNREKFIKTFENGSPKNFVSRLNIYPLDIENIKHIYKLISMGLQFLQQDSNSK